MRITLCTPTRGRPDRFDAMCRSVAATAHENVEIVALRDRDDPTNYMTEGVVYGYGPRPIVDGHHQMSGLWTKAWELGSGDIAMLCADDVVFETPGWDDRIREAFRSVPDRIVMVSTANGQDDRPLLPFVSREWIDAAGFTPPDLQGWFADEWIWSIAAELGRVIFLEDVMIRHNQFGGDSTYVEGQKAREQLGGIQGMRRNFYSIPMVKRRDELVEKLRSVMDPTENPVIGLPWETDSLAWNAQARRHERLIVEDTLVVVHCYKGDKEIAKNAMPQFLHHGAQVLVLSPEDSPVRLRRSGVRSRQGGRAAYYGQDSLDRQRKHLEMLLDEPYEFFLLNDADSMCLSPTIPRYLYEQSDGVVWSNEVVEWRPHPSPYPKIAMQPPYFLTRESIERMLAVADRITAHPITPFIDWYMLALTCEAGLKHRSFPDGASFPAWQRSEIAETQSLGHNPIHKNDPDGVWHGEWAMRDRVKLGAVLIHSVKHPEVLDLLVEAHADYVRRGAKPPNTLTIEEYVERQMDPMSVREGAGGFAEGESIRV